MNEYIKELKILRTEITALKNSISSIKKSNSAQFTVEYETDEEGNVKLDENGNPIIKESTVGKFSKLIIDEFRKYFNITYVTDENGNLVYDADNNPILGSTILDEEGNVIYDENNIPLYNKTSLGIVILFLLSRFDTINSKLNNIIGSSEETTPPENEEETPSDDENNSDTAS